MAKGNASQNYTEILSHSYQNGSDQENSILIKMQKKKVLHIVSECNSVQSLRKSVWCFLKTVKADMTLHNHGAHVYCSPIHSNQIQDSPGYPHLMNGNEKEVYTHNLFSYITMKLCYFREKSIDIETTILNKIKHTLKDQLAFSHKENLNRHV